MSIPAPVPPAPSRAPPGAHTRKVREFYRTARPLFDAITGGSGYLNFGLARDGRPEQSLRAAQERLARYVTRALPPRGRWLDMGCGLGGPAFHLAGRHPDLRIVAVNVSIPQCHRTHRYRETVPSGTAVDVVTADATAAPFRAGSFTGIYCLESAFHFEDRPAFLAGARRLLVPGGVLAVADIVRRPDCADPVDRLVLHFGRRAIAVPHLYTRDRWTAEMERVGLEPVAAEDITAETFGLLGSWLQRLTAARKRGEIPMPVWRYRFYRWGIRRFATEAAHGPLGYALVTARRPAEGGSR